MASITNRSNYLVIVEGEPSLTQRFAFSDSTRARSYLRELKNRGKPAVLTQLEDRIQIRIRDQGYPVIIQNVSSYQEAEDEIARIRVERKQGRRVDFNKGRRITLAALFLKYYDEECPQHKGCQTERYTLGAFLTDVAYGPYLERKGKDEAQSKKDRRAYRRHLRRTGIEWLLKPFGDLEPADFDRYVKARLRQGIKPSTIDREFDLIAAVINWAIGTLRYPVEIHPLKGFKRPRYFNERNRRLRGDEPVRLLASIREEDRIRSFKLAVEKHVSARQLEGPPRPGKSWNKYFILQARKRAKEIIGDNFAHVPFWETFCEYLITTTSRRSEALGLTWSNVFLEDHMAVYTDTKNGRSRDVPIRQHVIDLLRQLPRDTVDNRVFPVTGDDVDGAWRKICERAGVVDYHLHDNRHEGISIQAEIARAAGMPFDIVSLSALTGHRDVRSLGRYMNLCAGEHAHQIDQAYKIAELDDRSYRKGRLRVSGLGHRSITASTQESVSANGPHSSEHLHASIPRRDRASGAADPDETT